MATLVFDIETAALPLAQFDGAQQEYLFREAEKLADEIARAARREETAKFMSLWPFTAQVVCVAMLNAETQRGQVQFLAEDFEDDAGEAGPVEFKGTSSDAVNKFRDNMSGNVKSKAIYKKPAPETKSSDAKAAEKKE